MQENDSETCGLHENDSETCSEHMHLPLSVGVLSMRGHEFRHRVDLHGRPHTSEKVNGSGYLCLLDISGLPKATHQEVLGLCCFEPVG
jgi:hypothetical protein